MKGSDRRKFTRVPLNLLIQYRFDTFEDFVSEYAENLSEGGIFIHADAMRPLGAMVYLQFALRDGTRLIEALGRVVHASEDPAAHGLGIEFVNVDDESKAMIEAIVRERHGTENVTEDVKRSPAEAITEDVKGS